MQVRAVRGARKDNPRRNGFGAARKRRFLELFAATCNAKASARATGVSGSTIYAHRAKDPVFRAAWEAALEQGYARLEAELVRQASEGLSFDADEEAADAAARAIDPKVALAVLEAYRRNRGARPGDVLPQRSDSEEARRRLETVMLRLRIIDEEESASSQARPSIPSPDGEGKP